MMPLNPGTAGVPPASEAEQALAGKTRPQEELRLRLHALGFDAVRFASVSGPIADPLREWLGQGMHGDMHWIERTVDKRLNPDLVLPGARSVIVLGVSYWSEKISAIPAAAGQFPAWARYSLYEDYHDTMKPALVAAGRVLEELFGAQSDEYRYYVDTGPVLERSWAARSGIGLLGLKNTSC